MQEGWRPNALANLGLKQSPRIVDKQHVYVSIRCSEFFEFWNNVTVHEQILIWIALLEVVLLGNAAVGLFVVNVQANAVVGRAESFAVTHIHQAF